LSHLLATKLGGKLVFHSFGAPAEFERGIIRDRTLAGLQPANAAGHVEGRPPSLSQKDAAVAEALLNKPTMTAEETVAALRISTSSLYRYFPSDRASVSFRPRIELAATEPDAEELARRFRGRS
jgi:DNA invertase Pin-like site-specific DNA recombinase